MNLLGKIVILFVIRKYLFILVPKFKLIVIDIFLKTISVYFANGIVESAPRGGGGRGGGMSGGAGGKGNSSGKQSRYYLHGGLYPVSRTVKDAPVVKSPVHRGLGAWGIIGIVLGVLALCSGLYYALYLCDLSQRARSANYSSNLASQAPLSLMSEKPRPEENGNGNIPMTDKNQESKNDLSRGSLKNGLNEVFL